MKRTLFSSVLALVVAVLFSCNDASILGSNILPEENNLEVNFTDSISLIASTVRLDSTRVYHPNPSLQPGRYITGRVEDPVFGIYSSNIYTQLELLNTNPDFSSAVLDSVVLMLAYDNSGGYYGDLKEPLTLKVREVKEYISSTESYQSYQTFATAASTLGELTFVPAPSDSVRLSATSILAPHIRIPINNSLGQRLFNETDTTVFENDDNFVNYFNGIMIEGALNDNKATIGIDLLDNLSQLVFYYHQDTVAKTFVLRAKSGSAKTMHFNHTYDKGIYASLNPFIGNRMLSDSLVFLQGMEGHDVKIELPYINDWGKIVVNKAELIVRVAQDATSTLYPIPKQLILSRVVDDESEPVLIEDVTVSLSRTSSIEGSFGGQPKVNSESGEDITEYRMNISGYLQDVLDGTLENKPLYLEIFPKSDQPNRVILGGPKHSKYKMSIELTYTKLE
jgi:hypothetical protein